MSKGSTVADRYLHVNQVRPDNDAPPKVAGNQESATGTKEMEYPHLGALAACAIKSISGFPWLLRRLALAPVKETVKPFSTKVFADPEKLCMSGMEGKQATHCLSTSAADLETAFGLTFISARVESEQAPVVPADVRKLLARETRPGTERFSRRTAAMSCEKNTLAVHRAQQASLQLDAPQNGPPQTNRAAEACSGRHVKGHSRGVDTFGSSVSLYEAVSVDWWYLKMRKRLRWLSRRGGRKQGAAGSD
uniref:Uncharacterized protein n=1 Tax=Mycena chlorophos TaxID=658473 RepID=A0ABQ0LFU7_MYCCL|nr:predicted protein [Mycena chlorophos]